MNTVATGEEARSTTGSETVVSARDVTRRFGEGETAVDALRGTFIHFHQFDPRLGPIVLVVMAVTFFLIALRDFKKL